MQQPEKPAPIAEPECRRSLRLEVEARVVQPQLPQTFPQLLEIVGVDRIQTAPHHRHRRLEPRQCLWRRPPVVRDRIADVAVGHRLDRRVDVAHLPRSELVDRQQPRREHAHLVDRVGRPRRHHPDLHVALQTPVLDPHQDHHAQELIVPAIDQQRFERRLGIAGRRRQPRHQRLQHPLDVQPRLGRDLDRIVGRNTDHVLNLLAHPLRLRRRQVDLVEHRHDLVVGLQRLVDIGERLRLHPLRCINDQQRSFAGGQRPAGPRRRSPRAPVCPSG